LQGHHLTGWAVERRKLNELFEGGVLMQVRWAKESGLGGIMVWALDFDDFRGGSCGGQKFPLLKAINSELLG